MPTKADHASRTRFGDAISIASQAARAPHPIFGDYGSVSSVIMCDKLPSVCGKMSGGMRQFVRSHRAEVMSANSADDFLRGKELRDFACGGVGRIRAVHGVFADRLRMHFADGGF